MEALPIVLLALALFGLAHSALAAIYYHRERPVFAAVVFAIIAALCAVWQWQSRATFISLAMALYFGVLLVRRRSTPASPPPNRERSFFTRQLAPREALHMLLGAALVALAVYLFREYVSPRLEPPILHAVDLAAASLLPFVMVWMVVALGLGQFRIFRANELLAILVSLPMAVLLTVLGFLLLAHHVP